MKSMRSTLVGLTLSLLSVSATAAVVSVDGTNVRFTYENSTLYGVGSVVGDAILFTPGSFIAESLNGVGTVTATEMLNIQVEALNSGTSMKGFQLLEQGDYQLIGAGASAEVGGVFAVSSNTSGNSDSNNFSAGPLTVQGSLTEWATASMIDLNDTAGWGMDSDVDIDITNILKATTNSDGEQSLVQKKLGGVGLSIMVVPVPAAAWLFGSAMLGLVGMARRKRV